MRRGGTLKLLVVMMMLACAPEWMRAQTKPTTPRLEMRLAEEGWGRASAADVRAVLESAGRQLLVHFPGVKLEPLYVQANGGPITLFKRAADGSIVVKLNTRDTYWAQYAFQFGHELCHVLCRFDDGDRGNLWFEESLCELASLYVLRSMAEEWKVKAPYANWKSFAPHLAEYAKKRIDERTLPAGKTLAAWYRENAAELRKNPVARDRNRIVAGALLGLFEKAPEHWGAVYYLNAHRPREGQRFEAYLQNWRDQAPVGEREFIGGIAGEFGIKLEKGSNE